MTEPLTLASVPHRVTGVLEEELDDELVLWHDGTMHRLDPVGAVVWRSLDGQGPLGDLVADLASGFGASRSKVERDVLALCERFARAGLFGGHRERPPRPADEPAVGPGPRPGAARLDLVGWAHAAGPFRALGYDFAIRSTDLAVGRYLERALGSLTLDSAVDGLYVYSVVVRPGDGSYAIYLDDLDLVALPTPERVIRHLLWHVNTEVIRRSADHLLIHAAGAVADDGTAVLLPGPMNAGKTTLVAGLVQDGFGYLTDELVALNLRSGLVDPYPRPLNLSEGSWSLLPKLRPPDWRAGNPLAPVQWHVDLGSIRPGALAAPARPRFVVAPQFEAGAEPELVPMARGAALQLLVGEAMNLERHGVIGFRALLDVVRRCVPFRLRTGSLAAAVELVRKLANNHTG